MKVLICDIDGVLQKSTYPVDKNTEWDEPSRKKYLDSLVDNSPAISFINILLLNGWRVFLCTGRRKSNMGEHTYALAKKLGVPRSDIFFYPEVDFDRDLYLYFKASACESVDAMMAKSRSGVEGYFIDDDVGVCEYVQKISENFTKLSLRVINTPPF